MDTPKMVPAVVVGHVDLKPRQVVVVSHAKPAPKRDNRPQQRKPDRPQNPREVNAAQMAEFQFLKRRIKSFEADLFNYDALRVVVAQVLENRADATKLNSLLDDLKKTFTNL